MNPLMSRLAWLRRQLYVLTSTRGVFAVLALVVGAGIVAGLLDWWLVLPSMVRAFLLVGILTGTAYVALRLLIQPFFAPKDDLALALKVESSFPQLNDCLGSTVQFLKTPEETPTSGSSAMRRKAVEQAMQQSEGCDFGSILDRRGALAAVLGFVLVAAGAGYFFFNYPDYSFTATKRLADPFGNHTWTRVAMEAPEKIAVEKPFAYKARLDGVIPKNARLQVDGQKKVDELVIENDRDGAYVMVQVPLTKEEGTFRFRVTAGDGAYPPVPGSWHTVHVLPPPKLTFVQVDLDFPPYTEEPRTILFTGDKLSGITHNDFVPGSVVRLRAKTDKPLASAWVELRPLAELKNQNEKFRAEIIAGIFGAPMGAQGLPLVAGGYAAYGRFPARFLDDSRQEFAIDFQPWINGRYLLHLEDYDGLDRELSERVDLMPDPPPHVKLQLATHDFTPKGGINQLDVRGDAELNLLVTVLEERYAVRSAFLELMRQGRGGEAPLTVPLFDQAELSAIVEGLLAGFAMAPPGDGYKVRWQRLERFPVRWGLGNRFKVGDEVSLRAAAFDSCDVFLDREPGRSEDIRLRIVTLKDLLREEEELLPRAHEKIDNIRGLQDEILKAVKELRGKKSDELTPEDFRNLEKLKHDQERVEANLDHLLDDLNRRMLSRKVNKLPFTEPGDLTRTLRDELKHLLDNELPEIRDELAEAHEKLAGLKPSAKGKDDGKKGDGKKGDEKKDEEKKADGKGDPLARAADLQEKTSDALKEMSRMLDPFASLAMVKSKAKDLLLKHEAIREATGKLQDLKEKLVDPDMTERDKKRLKDDFKKDAAATAAAQGDLGTRADELMKMMADVAKKMAADKDMDNAGKLEKALELGLRSRVSDRMREVGGELKKDEPHLHRAMTAQERIKSDLARINDILNDKKPTDDMDRLAKKRKATGENLDKVDRIMQDLEDLRARAAKAMEIGDPKKKAEELEKIGKEQDELKKKAEEAAKELARLNEPKAAKAMADAAKEIGKGADKARGGEDPGENIDAAMEKVEEAQGKLQEVQDELAREQLAQVAELIKAVKERQDAAIQRGDELHKRVMDRKLWSEGLIDTLSGDILTQEGLAKETHALKEKLKDAVVFEHIMDKAARSMERAAEEMIKRKEEARNRQVDAMLKEELDDEARRHEAIKKHQVMASTRLDRLLEAIKNENPPKKDAGKKDGDKKEPPPKVDGGGGGGGPGDSIPPIAQLKALKMEQMEIRERTKEFDARHPDRAALPPDAERELRELQMDQVRIHQLFEEMTRDKKGGQP